MYLYRRFFLLSLTISYLTCDCVSLIKDIYVEEALSEKSRLFDKDALQTPIYRDSMFYQYLHTNVVFIIGTSSAGKTSIINQMQKKPSSYRTLFCGTDDISDEIIVESIYKYIPRKNLEHIPDISKGELVHCFFQSFDLDYSHQITKDKILCKYAQLINSIEWKYFINNIQDFPEESTESLLCQKGKVSPFFKAIYELCPIVLDVVDPYPFICALEHYFIRSQIYFIYIYCNPRVLLQHIIAKNERALQFNKKDEMRFFFPFKHYNLLYTPTAGITKFSQVVQKDDFRVSIGKAMGDIVREKNISMVDFRQVMSIIAEEESFESPYQQHILTEWFGINDQANIIPKLSCDAIIDTNIISPRDSADMIVQICNSK